MYKKIVDGLSDVYKTPCVVFCGHPSLRCGDTVHFMEVWGPGSQNSVIFIGIVVWLVLHVLRESRF